MIFLEFFYPSVLVNRKAGTVKGLGHSISYVGDTMPHLQRTLNKKENRDIRWGNYRLPIIDNIPVFLNQGMHIQITIILVEFLIFNNNKIFSNSFEVFIGIFLREEFWMKWSTWDASILWKDWLLKICQYLNPLNSSQYIYLAWKKKLF